MPAMDNHNNQKPSILKNTREAKGLTLEIVHEATKIPLDALKAIEEGYSSRILSPFYYRGFIKMYAEFLGLDVKEMYKYYGIDEPAKPAMLADATPPPRPSSPKPRPMPAPSAKKVSTGPGFTDQLQEKAAVIFQPKNIAAALKFLGFIILIVLFFKVAGCAISHLHHKTVPRRQMHYIQPKKVIVPKESEEDNQQERAAPAPVEVKHNAVQVQSEDDKVEVAVRATRNTWLQVKADGKVVFQMTLSKGSMETWTADDHIELSGRNLELLDMEINGKHIGSLGGGERRIRRVLINKQGLTVKK